MDNKDGRRSRVPAGTFGGSEPPPAPAGRPPGAPPPPPPARSAHAKTLTGEEDAPVAPPPPPPPPEQAAAVQADDPAELEGRKRHVSTLVGVPAIAARSAAPPSSTPMLAPPPWRGAQPYLAGEEPQLRISSMPAPTHVPAAPSASSEPTRGRVTTKMAPVPPAPVHPPSDGSTVAGGAVSPALGDTIQEMLDAQASVPMQVEEQADRGDPALRSAAAAALRSSTSSEATPIDEVPIEEILESLSEPPPPIESAEPARKRHDEPTLVHAAPPPADGPRISEPEPEPAQPKSVAAAETQSESVPVSVSDSESEPEPVKAPEPVKTREPAAARPAPPPPPAQARERPRRAVSAPVAGSSAAPVTSLAPAEVSRRPPRYRDDAQAGLGIVLVAAMGVIGVGGWFLTRGGYPRAQPQTQAVATTLPAPAPPALPPAQPPIVAPAQAPIAAASEPSSSAAASAASKTVKKPLTKPLSPARPGAKPEPDDSETQAPEPAPSEDQVLKVTPRRDAPAAMTDIPSRDDVLAALAPIRAAVTECARGQRGVAQLDITVANTGFVTHAVVGGDFAGTPEGSCIARVARSAQFVPFKKPRFRVIYPFSL